MALSREEQQRLEELEALLAKDDPKLAHTLRGTRPNPVDGRRALISGAGFLAGIGLLIAGMQWHWSISVVGFVVMLAAAAHLIGASRSPRSPQARPNDRGSVRVGSPSSRRAGVRQPRSSGFMDKMEDRWRRRQQGGL